MAKASCSVRNCRRPVIAKGLCDAHYQRLKKWGVTLSDFPIGDRQGPRNRNWKGGKATLPDGRVLVFAPEHPHAGVSGCYVLRYRLVMEQHLGRYLRDEEIVHHRNGDVTDDRIENLEILSQAEHALHHSKVRKRRKNGQFA